MPNIEMTSPNEFGWLDDPQNLTDYAPDNKRMQFYVENVKCGGCVRKIEGLSEESPHFSDVRYNMHDHIATVHLAPGGRFSRFAELMQERGFPVHPLQRNVETETLQRKENHRELREIAVAGVAAGNIMLFSTSIYAGASQFHALFHWISFFLILPVVGYSARPLWLSSWAALRSKTPSIDLPIVFAIAIGFVFSTVHLLQGYYEGIYFDSLAVLIFLILTSRKVLKSWQHQHFVAENLGHFLSVVRPLLKTGDGQWQKVSTKSLKPGDIIQIGEGNTCPVDGVLKTSAEFDFSILTGESLPRRLDPGQSVFAGTRLLSATAEIQVTATGDQSRMGELLKSVEDNYKTRPHFLLLTDRISQFFTLAIVAITFLAMTVFSFTHGIEEAMTRALAFAMIACPCALAFISPLIFSMTLFKANQLGLIVKNTETLERLNKVRRLFFDKTGTLTTGHLKPAVFDLSALSLFDKQALYALEGHSDHPIAIMIRRYLRDQGISSQQTVDNFKYQPGRGISGTIEGHFFELRASQGAIDHSNDDSVEIAIEFFKDGQLLSYFALVDQLKPDARRVIGELKDMGYELCVLSGDAEQPVQRVCRYLGVSNYKSRQTPEQKALCIDQDDSMMIGDGVNDSASMAQSLVSVSVRGSAETVLKIADAYMPSTQLSPILNLLRLAHQSRTALIVILSISVIYNFMAGLAALTGFVTPLVAAILMPASTMTMLAVAVTLLNPAMETNVQPELKRA